MYLSNLPATCIPDHHSEPGRRQVTFSSWKGYCVLCHPFFFLSEQCNYLSQSTLLLSLFNNIVMSDSSWPHGLQHVRLACPSPSPRVCPSSCPLHQWCHPTISSSAALFSFCLQSFPASESFPMSRLFPSGRQSIGASTSASVLPMSIQGWFPPKLTGLISLLSKGLSRVFSSTTVWKHQFFVALPSSWSSYHNPMWLLERPQARLYWPLSVMSLIFNKPSMFVMPFLPRSNCFLISRLQSPFVVILEPKKKKFVTASTFPPSFCHEVMGLDATILVFKYLVLSQLFTLLFHPHQEVS